MPENGTQFQRNSGKEKGTGRTPVPFSFQEAGAT
jgi:hypothetical protein